LGKNETDMSTDEQQIRDLIATWMAATKAGDTETVLGLIADNAVFLVPGQPPMRKAGFATALAAQTKRDAPKFDAASEVQEIQVIGDWAFMWTRLKVVVHPPDGAPPIVRVGHTLSVLQKQGGKWLLARDANMLAPASNHAS
jgi:uncharacterized protein (TIGR02246 family)